MTIYLDVIWFLNLCIDFLLLWLTALILKRNTSKKRLFLGALMGSLYVFFLFAETGIVYHPIVKLLYSAIIIMITFGYKRFASFVQGLFMFYFTTFITGGGLLGIHYFLQTDAQIINGVMQTKSSGLGDPVSWLFVVLLFPVLIVFTKKRVNQLEVRKLHYEQIMTFEVKIDSLTFKGTGLMDSGNQLHDPLSKHPVMILDTKEFQNQLPKVVLDQAENLEHIGQNDEEEPNPWIDRLRLIPFRAVGSNNQFLTGIKPDHVHIWQNNVKYETRNVIVGLSLSNISGEGDYNAILHPKMIVNAKVTSSAS
ncbi:sigma-E processing peptidase SpoIIGA [Pseudalkalibacillus decolorationis]|uniref:sigma-E processing peptidase SpoIIGA n=1 Tax=Pseudalkalibacillus decolorationis TaxID=163879 RepID=UPI002147B279|nr:sigma-E processing peptidase SpoIIGA [Pseudalkalibacillus decolorationis]